MISLKPGDAVVHKGYPLGILRAIRPNLGNGQQFGMVQLHGYTEESFQPIPLDELSLDINAALEVA